MAAGVIMSALMLATGRGLPKPRLWGPLALLGFLMNIVGNGFVVYAQQFVASGLTAVLIATTPFWSALVERLLPNGERFSKRSLAGLALGFTGIVVLVWPEMTNGGAGGRSFVHRRDRDSARVHRLGDRHVVREAARARRQPVSLDGAADGVQRHHAADAATAHGDWAQLSFTPRTIAAMAYLSIAGSLVAYSAYIYAIQHLPLQLVSLYAYINPMIAVALGTLLLNEPLSARIIVAAALVFAGTWIVGRR